MSRRRSIVLLSLLSCICFVTPVYSQITVTTTRDCSQSSGVTTGVNFTATVTVDRNVMHIGDTAHGTYSNNAYAACQNACQNNPACGPDGVPLFDGTGGVATTNTPTTWSSTENGTIGPSCQTSGTDSPDGVAQFCHPDTSSGTFQFTVLDPSSVPGYSWPTAPYSMQLCASVDGFYILGGCPDASISILVDNTSDLGPCDGSTCEAQAGDPINMTDGNTYIQQTDYVLPGLGGGINLTRTWNSQWLNNSPWETSGMFGDSWQSNYEAYIQLTQTGAKYWRGDGSAWTFAYSGGVYSLSSPPNVRASLSFSTSTNQFTLAQSNGTKEIFSQPGYLLSIVDRNGNSSGLSYDGSNRLSTVTDAAGRVLTFNYGNPSLPAQVTSIVDAVGTIATYAYDANAHLLSVTYADGSVINLNSDANGLVTSTTDAVGKTLEAHSYDTTRRGLTSQRAGGVDSVSLSYGSGVATLTDSAAHNTQYAWTRIGNRNFMSSVAGSGCDTCGGRRNYQFSYDSFGNRTQSIDPMGHATNYLYDNNGNVTQKGIQMDSVPNYQYWNYTYNGFNEVLTTTDPLGNVMTNTYDGNGNLLTSTAPSPGGKTKGSKTTFTYNTKGELTKATDPLNNATTIAYYSTGLIESITNAQSKVTQYQYDSRGNRTAVIDANNQQTTFTYDSMNRLTKVTYPTSPATYTQIAYDYRGRKNSVTDQNNKIIQYSYDDADRLISVTDPNNGVTQYAYDNENNLTSIMDASSHSTTFQYDQYGSLTQTGFPSTLIETYSYDANGNLLSKTDRNGHTINYGYDFLNRLTSKTYPDSSTASYTYDNDNRMTQVLDPTGTYKLTYDGMSRVTQTSVNYSFLSGKTFTIGYSYDAASNRTSMSDPQTASTAYVFDTLNRLSMLTYPSRNSYGFSYDALDRQTQLTRPNSVTTTYQYDNVSDILSILHAKSGTTLDGTAYTYDAAGNRTSKTDERTSIVSDFSYDPLYELTQVTQGSNTSESYTYDATGNRLSSLAISPYNYNASNELTSTPTTTFTYDNNGNVLTKADSTGTTTYAWDYENRLTSVTLPGSGGTVNFKYEPFGKRIQKTSTNGTTNYIYDGINVLEEVDASGNMLARYVQSNMVDEPLAETRGSVTSYYESDGIGSITSLSNSSASLVNTYTYDSYGKLTASTGTVTNPFQYTARSFDSETGLYYYRARYYDPASGRFVSEDPVRFNTIDSYVYTGNNPTDAIDPDGTTTTVFTLGGRVGGPAAGMGQGFQPFGHSSIEINNSEGDWVYSFDEDDNGNLILYKVPTTEYFYGTDPPGVFDYAPNRTVMFQQLNWRTDGKEEAAVQAYLEGLFQGPGKFGKFGAVLNNCAVNAAKALRKGGLPLYAITPEQLFQELDLSGAVRLTGGFSRTLGRILW